MKLEYACFPVTSHVILVYMYVLSFTVINVKGNLEGNISNGAFYVHILHQRKHECLLHQHDKCTLELMFFCYTLYEFGILVLLFL